MAPGVRAPDGAVGAKLHLEPAHAFAAVAHRRRPVTAGAGLLERGPRFIPARAVPPGGPAEAAVVASTAPSPSARRPPAPGGQQGPPSPALPRLPTPQPAPGPDDPVGFAALARGAFHDHAWPAAAVLGLIALLLALRTLQQCTAAMVTITRSLRRLRKGGT